LEFFEHFEETVSQLEVADIVRLCYALGNEPERLSNYFKVLGTKEDEVARLASALIAFDLGRQGDHRFQEEFLHLAEELRQSKNDRELVSALIGDIPYLKVLWKLCREALADADPRFDAEQILRDTVDEEEPSVDLKVLTDSDFGDGQADFAEPLNEDEKWFKFQFLIEEFFGGTMRMRAIGPEGGFRIRNRFDVDRVEATLRELKKLEGDIPRAGAYRAWLLLFYGTHMRSWHIFGRMNRRKQRMLLEGLQSFTDNGPRAWQVAGVFKSLFCDGDVWPKIVELLEDYVSWIAQNPDKKVKKYDPITRLEAIYERRGEERRDEFRTE